jgi:hypothetical protein
MNKNMLSRITALAAVTTAIAGLSGVAHASDPVVDASGTGKANCTAVVKFVPNSGSSRATFEEHVGKQVIQVTLSKNTKYQNYVHGKNGAHWSLWGPADVRLAHGTIPAQCPGGSPHAFISVTSDCVAHYYLDTHDRVKGPQGDVAFLVFHGKKSNNVVVHHQKTSQPPKLVTRQLAPGQVARVEVLGHVADRVKAPLVCAPTP